MSESDLKRVRGDLATMEQALDLGLPFGRLQVWLHLGLFAAGLFWAVWAALAPWGMWILLGVVPGILVLLGWVFLELRKGAPRARREAKIGTVVAVVLIVLVEAYFAWGKSLGIPVRLVGAIGLFFVGVALIPWALSKRGRLHGLGAAIPLMLFGVAVPVCTARQVVVGAGMAIAVAGLAVAAIQSWQLRRSGQTHAAN